MLKIIFLYLKDKMINKTINLIIIIKAINLIIIIKTINLIMIIKTINLIIINKTINSIIITKRIISKITITIKETNKKIIFMNVCKIEIRILVKVSSQLTIK
jgi:hypothetical protein